MTAPLAYTYPSVFRKCDQLFYRNNLKKALKELTSDKPFLEQNDYKLVATAVMGYVPSDTETDIIFGGNDVLTREDVERVIDRVISANCQDVDREIYYALDRNFKGYIDFSDLNRVREIAAPNLSIHVLLECFRDAACGDKLSYAEFEYLCWSSETILDNNVSLDARSSELLMFK